MAGVWKRDGTVTVTSGSKRVIGVGTTFADPKNGVAKGHIFTQISGSAVDLYEVDYVVSNTELYLVQAFRGTTASGAAYAIITTFSDSIPEFSRKLTATLASYQEQSDVLQLLYTSDAAEITVTAPDGTTRKLIPWKRVTSEGEGQAARAKVEADRAKTEADKAAQVVIDSAVPFPDVWIPFNDSLRMFAGYGREVKVGDDVVARMVNFERSTTATYIDKSGVLRTAAINEPRFEKQGLLMEGQSTNLITNSSSVGSNYNSNLTVTNNPDGTKTVSNNASSQNTSGTAGRRMFIVGAQVQPNTTYTFSMVCSGRHMLIAYGAGLGETKSVVSGSESGIGCASITVTTGSSGGALSVEIYGGTTSAHYDFPPFTFVGYQLEALPFASSYIPTNGTAVTRAADKCWIARLLNMQSSLPAGLSVALTFNKTGFTAGLSNYVVSLVDIENHDRYGIATGDTITPNYTFDGYGNAFSGQLTTAGGEATLVMSLGEDGARACRVNNMFVNGTTGDTRRKVVTQGMIKFCDRVGEGTRAWGHVRNFRIWHRALSAAQIKGLA
nr:hypothetical protein [Plesiomonas shigelloides]